MSPSVPDPLRDRLLAADAPIPDAAYKDYRMQLENRLNRAVVMEQFARWVMIGLWGSTLAVMFLTMALTNLGGPSKPPEWVGAILAVLNVAAIVETIFYFTRYRVALSRARDDHQTALLQELTRQVSELSRRLDEPRGRESANAAP